MQLPSAVVALANSPGVVRHSGICQTISDNRAELDLGGLAVTVARHRDSDAQRAAGDVGKLIDDRSCKLLNVFERCASLGNDVLDAQTCTDLKLNLTRGDLGGIFIGDDITTDCATNAIVDQQAIAGAIGAL